MTAALAKRYACAHCPETFVNPVKLGGHVHARHPEHRRPTRKLMIRPVIPARGPRPGGSLKRDTDVWPGKP